MSSLQKLHFRQILRVDYPDRFIPFVDNDEVVNSMLIQDVQYFDGKLCRLNSDWMRNHMLADGVGNHGWVSLKSPDKVAVGEYAGQFPVWCYNDRDSRTMLVHRMEHSENVRFWTDLRHPCLVPHNIG